MGYRSKHIQDLMATGFVLFVLTTDMYRSGAERSKRKYVSGGCFFYQITEAGLHDNPKLKRIYYRYGAWRKKLRKKTSRKGGD